MTPELLNEKPKLELYEGDCLEILKTIPDKSIDLVLTDPPYGINADKGVGGFGSSKTDRHYEDNWDKETPTDEYFKQLFRVSKNQIVWGGNFFNLPKTGGWIYWNKIFALHQNI